MIRKRKDDLGNICYDVYLPRGDSKYLDLFMADRQGNVITPSDNDTVAIQVRKTPNGGTLLFDGTVTIADGVVTWHILPENTEGAEIGEYVWDAQWTPDGSTDVFTFISLSKFVITDESTEREAEGG